MSKLDDIAEIIAARIGSPWGEGATYDISRAPTLEDIKDGSIYTSHLDDEDREEFKTDLKQQVRNLMLELIGEVASNDADDFYDNLNKKVQDL